MNRRALPILASVLALAGAAALSPAASMSMPAAPAADETGAIYKRLTDTVGPAACVTVKCVMKVEGRPAARAGKVAIWRPPALVIEPAGLVLASNAKMGGLASRMGMSVTPTNIKVLIGDDTEGLKAKILVKDPDLDLCWITIDDEKAKGKTFTAVDFASSSPAAVGDKLFVVARMGKFFDHALSVDEGRVGGATKKPRALFIPSGFSGGQREMLGTPMFAADGKVVGVNIVQIPDKEDMEGGESGGEGNTGILLLPAAEIVKATIRGKEMAAKNPPKEDDKAGDAKKDDTKKDEPKKDEPKKP